MKKFVWVVGGALALAACGGSQDTRVPVALGSLVTPTSAPWMPRPLARAALNVASPHGVGGYVLRMPKLGAEENP